MTRVKKVKIGYATWSVRWLHHEEWPAAHPNDCGLTRRMEQEILIRLSGEDGPYGEDVLKDTLLHEMMHALYFVSGLQQYTLQSKSKDQEEYTIAMLSGPLLAALQHNPSVTRYLATV